MADANNKRSASSIAAEELSNKATSEVRESLFRSRESRSRRRNRARAHVDYEEMTVSYGKIKLGVPAGFRELLEDLTRGVIRERPNNIALWLARHFQELEEKQRLEKAEQLKAKLLAEKLEAERLEKERLEEIARLEEEARLKKEEEERVAAELAEIAAKKAEAERLEQERQAAEQAKAEKLAALEAEQAAALAVEAELAATQDIADQRKQELRSWGVNGFGFLATRLDAS